MKNKFDLIIFDWDGTLIDSIDWIARCLKKAGELCGLAEPEHQAAKDVIGLSIDKAMHTLFPDTDANIQKQLISHYSREYFSKEISRDDLFTGVYDMLLQLKADGYQLAVATGKTRAGLDEALAGTGTADLFCATRCADETASKPDPRMLNEIIAHTGACKSRSLMVGDSMSDILAARGAGVPVATALWDAYDRPRVMAANPAHAIPPPQTIPIASKAGVKRAASENSQRGRARVMAQI
jgi:phosphoglycolate phosphatase